jgi:hypothetical protein
MDKAQIFEQMQKRKDLLNGAIPQMLERSKTGKQDVSVIKRVDAIMKSSKSPAQKKQQLEQLLKQIQS